MNVDAIYWRGVPGSLVNLDTGIITDASGSSISGLCPGCKCKIGDKHVLGCREALKSIKKELHQRAMRHAPYDAAD